MDVGEKLMEKKNKIDVKNINLDKVELTKLIGEIISRVYGVVGVTHIKSKKNKLVILKEENYSEGIIVNKVVGNKYDVEIHLIVAYGIRIVEVINEVVKRIRYEVKKRYGLDFLNIVNVYVEDLLDL